MGSDRDRWPACAGVLITAATASGFPLAEYDYTGKHVAQVGRSVGQESASRRRICRGSAGNQKSDAGPDSTLRAARGAWPLEAWADLAGTQGLPVKSGPLSGGRGRWRGHRARGRDACPDLQRRPAQKEGPREDAESALPHCFGFSPSRSRAF